MERTEALGGITKVTIEVPRRVGDVRDERTGAQDRAGQASAGEVRMAEDRAYEAREGDQELDEEAREQITGQEERLE